MNAANLFLRFVLEMAAILAVAYWGFTQQDGVWAWVAGLGAPALVVAALAVAFAVVAVVSGSLNYAWS